MNRRSGLNLALLAAVIALALFAYYKPHQSAPEYKLSTIKAADATSIKIEIAGSPPIALARTGAEWKLTAPLAARADSLQVQRVLEILDATAKDRFPATGLARYDLNEPPARVTINQQSFGFGAVNQMSREQYALTQDGVFPVSLRYGTLLPRTPHQMVSRQLFAAEEAPVAFRFPDFALAQRDGKWQLTPPAADLSADDVTRWVDEWRLATALGVLPASNRKPVATIMVTLKAGAEITVAVLQREPQLVLARSDQPFEYQLSAETAKRLLAPPAAEPAKNMPELPEVETTRRGLAPHVCGATVTNVVVRNRAMRQPVTRNLARILTGRRIDALERRAKYLLFRAGDGTLIVHLGMSGRLWLVNSGTPPATHDHFDLALANGRIVRLRDPRRFGLVLWHAGDPLKHKLLRDIGPEPLSTALSADWLYRETRTRSGAIKNALMDSHLIAGVGNIYANEALFRARINPRLPARRIGLARYAVLVDKIRETLAEAIDAGGSSLRDYVNSAGEAGYFQNRFFVYGRGGDACLTCKTPVRSLVLGQRATFYCPRCQR